MYKETSMGLEVIIGMKDAMIVEHSHTISKLTSGNVYGLKDIKHMFFTK